MAFWLIKEEKHPLVGISRLSLLPMSAAEWNAVLALAGKK